MAAVFIDNLRVLSFGGISGTYATIGTALAFNFRAFRVINATNGDVFVSTDGTNNKLFLPANSFVLYDLAANAPNVHNTDGFVFAAGTQFYVKQSTAPSSGAVYIEGIYAVGV